MAGRLFSLLVAAGIATASLWLLLPSSALAHEQRDVGKYHLVVGFIVEPNFEGQKNGVDLRVTNTETQKPVEGLEKTLQVEITHVTSGTSKTFKLRAIFRDPGHYTNDLVFSAPGQYRLRFFGDIEGTLVNETFISGPGRFNDVEASADLQFPERLPELREVSGAVKGAQTTAQQAQDGVSSAKILATLGVVLGALGIVSSIGVAVMLGRKR